MLRTPIAIVGMSCRLPGADNLAEYWQLLVEGRDGVVPLPPERLDRSLYFHPEKGHRGKTYSDLGGLIKDRPLDASLFPQGKLPQEDVDLCHAILCEVALSACHHAGYQPTRLKGQNVGVYIGHSGGSPSGGELAYGTLAAETVDYLRSVPGFAELAEATQQAVVDELVQRLRAPRPRRRPYGKPYFDANGASNLIAKTLELNGPNMVIDAACASSLVAISMGALALQHGQIDAALVGGASFAKCDSLILFSHAQSCSASGSRPFDEQADGLISSEGYVVLMIKTLERAEADGDTIHAVIRGVGMSSDGRGRSLWAPRKEGQFAALQRAYAGQLDPRRVQYLEAHATSTQVGDATELESLVEFFTPHAGGRKIPIGSVKSNLGHTLETAGVAGLLKLVLAMQHGQIPPSIHFREPNQTIDWTSVPFAVAERLQSWPEPEDGPRLGGVSAFGIGGLNVHVVVEQHRSSSNSLHVTEEPVDAVNVIRNAREHALAIVGRGVVMPGAHTVDAFARWLASSESAISDAPDTRWRSQSGVRAGEPQHWQTPTSRGGYILGYEYDWRRFKIPPKQIAQANPLQFMLLDAAQQALDEANFSAGHFDRSTTAVVVGTMFGGEFGNQLQVGLRLPELQRAFFEACHRRQIPQRTAAEWWDQYERNLLAAKPALLDETGSFTSSTLASRITKTLDLQGGALAIDAGEASSFAALAAASDLLRSGTCSLVLCAGAQHALDLVTYESLALDHRLLSDNGSGYLPGEGVGVVLLQRLVDAERTGARVLGVIQGVGAGFDDQHLDRAVHTAVARSLCNAGTSPVQVRQLAAGCGVERLDRQESQGLVAGYGDAAKLSVPSMVPRCGHLHAAQGMAELIRLTLDPACQPADNDEAGLIAMSAHATSGLAYHVLAGSRFVEPRVTPPIATGYDTAVSPQLTLTATAEATLNSTRLIGSNAPAAWPGPTIVRFGGMSLADLKSQLLVAQQDPQHCLEYARPTFPAGATHRLTITARDPAELTQRLEMARFCDRIEARTLLEEQGICCYSPDEQLSFGGDVRPRVVFLFSGQGSQQPGMMRTLANHSPAAAECLHQGSAILLANGLPSFEEIAWHETGRLGVDAIVTQLSVLIADCMMLAALAEMGLQPDVVSGHSYGEFAAYVAAGVWTLEQAVRVTRVRAQAVADCGSNGGLVSVGAPVDVVQTHIQQLGLPLFITHINSPAQVVVGGTHEALVRLQEACHETGTATKRLSVPGAMHTPLLAPAQVALRNALARETLRPPRMPLLSNVTNQYVADPHSLQENLIRQLVEPVRYTDLITRLVHDDIAVFIEVGPGRVLTQLHRQILNGLPVRIVATDESSPDLDRLTRVRAMSECLGLISSSGEPLPRATMSLRSTTSSLPPAASPEIGPDPLQFDATTVRKNRLRAQSQAAVSPPSSNVRPSLTPQHPFSPSVVASPAILGSPTDMAGIDKIASQSATELTPMASLAESNAATPASASLPPADELQQFLIDFVVEQTGYPPDMIEMDWDLEADLGIDSIKKAQLLGELRDLFGLEWSASDVNKRGAASSGMDSLRTLRAIMEHLQSFGVTPSLPLSDSEAVPSPVPPVPPVAESLTSSETAAYQVSPTNGTAGSNGHRHNAHASSPVDRHPEPPALVDLAEVERFLIDFVVDQTGYPPEIVELDAELEADLGIDSIKKAQLFGEIREQFAPQAAPNADGASAERNTLGQFRCLRDVLDWVGQELKAPPESPPASTSRSPAPVTSSPYSSPPAAMAESVTDLDRVAVPSSDPMRQCDTSSDNADTPVAVRSSLVSPHFVASEAVPRGTVEELAMRAKLRKQMARMLERRRHWPTDALDRLAPTEMLAMLSPATLRELIGQSERTGLHLGSLVANYLHETSSGNDPADTFALDNDVCSKGNGNARRTKDSENAHHEADNGRAAGNGDVARASHHNQVTSRYLLTVEPSPPSDAGVQTPSWNGACIILGDNPLVSVLRQRIEQTGGRAHWIRPTASPATAIAELERIWQTEPALHVFLTTPHDDDAMTSFHAEDWQRRRGPAIESPFWFCQRWYQLVKDAKLMDDASLVGFTRLGGDFGFSGNVTSAESGAITGMLKAIIIESWVAGHRTIPIKLIDSPGNEPADSIVSAAFRELAQPSYDVEISCRGGERAVVRAVESPLGSSHAPTHTLPHGTWVFTGGARGITAYVAEQLALRYSLSLQLIGTAPVPNVPEHWRDMTEEQRRREKLNVMQEARAKGDNPIKAWENAEKAIEIDATLRRLRSLGIEVQYHSCDVSDRTALAGVLQTIRQQNGPIRGVLHGAGVGKDSRFEHKRPDKVDQCIRAKVDGTLALMDLTREDPLDHFVAFGSISGRFGANGHADYSLANDTLAKLVDWYRRQRPDVCATAFHWHAWGDVGMATKAETRLALEMIDMQFMPAEEGLRHLVQELEHRQSAGEVLITDDKYFRLFYPAETIRTASPSVSCARSDTLALLDATRAESSGAATVYTADLDPDRDPFLLEHRLADQPLLPIVVGLELLAEAAQLSAPEAHVLHLRDVEAVNGLRFFQNQIKTVNVTAAALTDGKLACSLTADFCARNGRVVEPNREYLRAVVELGSDEGIGHSRRLSLPTGEWQSVQYAERGAPFYLGPPLRCLRKVQMATGKAWGRIVAPALIELAGPARPAEGWLLPSAVLDACLYSTGLLAWSQVATGTALPAFLGHIQLGRAPRPGESCLVESTLISHDERTASFNFTLFGSDEVVLIDVQDYRVVWLMT